MTAAASVHEFTGRRHQKEYDWHVCLVQKGVQNAFCGPWARGARSGLLQGAPWGTGPLSERVYLATRAAHNLLVRAVLRQVRVQIVFRV